MFTNVTRVCRSFEESVEWVPDWRNCQATAYLRHFDSQVTLAHTRGSRRNVAAALLREVEFPAWENDELVKARFLHLAEGPVPDRRLAGALDWAQGCIRNSAASPDATSMKGWLLAGLSDGEIAERNSAIPFNIGVFHDVWFDVRGSLAWPYVLFATLCNPQLPAGAPAWMRRERVVLKMALSDGAEGVDRLLRPRHLRTEADLQWLSRHRQKVQALRAWERTLLNAASGPRDEDILIHQRDQRISANRELAIARDGLDDRARERYLKFAAELLAAWEEHGVETESCGQPAAETGNTADSGVVLPTLKLRRIC